MDTLIEHEGYYEQPAGGKLVAYAGTYTEKKTGKKKRYLGRVYFNFAALEQEPRILLPYVRHLAEDICRMGIESRLVFCGLPEGGKSIAFALADCIDGTYIYPEKKVLVATTKDSREESELVFSRHEVKPGAQVILAEDVANNFSTTGKAVDIVTKAGGIVKGIACMINRSPKPEHDMFFFYGGQSLPIFSGWRKPVPEYEQDDPAIASEVEAGNVCWEPKKEWGELQLAMKNAA